MTNLNEPSACISGGVNAAYSVVDQQIKDAQKQVKILGALINQQRQHLCSLRSIRNGLPPISELPSELLARIFEFYIYSPELRISQNGLPDYESTDPLANIQWRDIMRVMCVCRTWRSTALNCPRFWSQIIYREPSTQMMTEIMLDRSKASPLYIRMSDSASSDHLSGHAMSSFRSKIMDIKRIRHLHLHFRSVMLDFLFTNMDGSATDAEHLWSVYLHGDGRPSGEYSLRPGPQRLYAIHTPNLQHLEIDSYTVSWPEFLSAAEHLSLQNLTSLKLTPINERPTPGQLYGILTATPKLKVLHLSNALPEEHTSHNVSLPDLSSCTILSSSVFQCAEFLSNVSFPTTTAKFSFCASSGGSIAANPLSLLDKLLGTLGLSIDNSNRSHSNLFFEMPSISQLKACLWDDSKEPFPQRFHMFDTRHSSVILDFTQAEDELGIFSLHLLQQLTISGLTRVGIHHRDTLTLSEEWSCFFQNHPDITHLQLFSPCVEGIMTAISTPVHPLHVDPVPNYEQPHNPSSLELPPPCSCLCLPNLTKLILEDHGYASWSLSPAHLLEMMDEDIESVVNFSFVRCNYGMPLQELQLTFCEGWSLPAIKLLSEAVVSVAWVGLVPPYHDGLDESDSEYGDSTEVSDSAAEGSEEGDDDSDGSSDTTSWDGLDDSEDSEEGEDSADEDMSVDETCNDDQ